MLPITEKHEIKTNGIDKKNISESVPLSGVSPRLKEMKAIGLKKAVPKIHIKTKFFLSSLFTSLGVR